MILQRVDLATMHPLASDPGEVDFGAEKFSALLEEIFSCCQADIRWRSDFFPDG